MMIGLADRKSSMEYGMPRLSTKSSRRVSPLKERANADAAPMNATAAKLLVAAGDLMIARNSTDISLSEIAAKSGVNAALVKYHFGNKDGLLLALLARDAKAEIRNLAFVMEQPISPTEKLRRHIAGIINAYYRFPYMNRLIHLLLHDGSEATAKEVKRFFVKPLFEFQRLMLAEGIAAGEFRKFDPALFYTSLVGACDHLFYGRQMDFKRSLSEETRRQYIAHTTDLILGGMLARKSDMPKTNRDKTNRNL